LVHTVTFSDYNFSSISRYLLNVFRNVFGAVILPVISVILQVCRLRLLGHGRFDAADLAIAVTLLIMGSIAGEKLSELVIEHAY